MDKPPDYHRRIALSPSWRTRALNSLLRLTMRRRITQESDVSALRREYEEIDARYFQVAPDVQHAGRLRWRAGRVDRFAGQPARARHALPAWWIICLSLSECARRAGVAPLSASRCAGPGAPDYRLAPEHPFPAAPDDCQRVCRALIAQGVVPASMVLAGDSAGGNLALVTIHRAKAAGEPLPSCVVLLSPALDCTLTSRSMADYDGHDPMLQLSTLLVLRRCYGQSPHQSGKPSKQSPVWQTGARQALSDNRLSSMAT